jgi:hypothetical protein
MTERGTDMRKALGGKRWLMVGAMALALSFGTLGAQATVGVEQAHAAWWNNDDHFKGYIEKAPDHGYIGLWTIGGRTVQVTHDTEIDTDGYALRVGMRVEVEGTLQSDGTFLASEIEYDD